MRTKRLAKHFKGFVEGKYPSAGPNPSIKGMKEKFYGKDSMCVICGSYLYNLPNTDEGRLIYYRLAY